MHNQLAQLELDVIYLEFFLDKIYNKLGELRSMPDRELYAELSYMFYNQIEQYLKKELTQET